MPIMNRDTIVALSTASGKAAVGMIRLSGNDALQIAKKIFDTKDIGALQAQKQYFGKVINDKEFIDEVLLTYFKNPKSYTGEDVIEISAHGSPYILNKIVGLCQKHGARLAQAGEFTQRAFLNGKLDLSQAESVADLIAVENKMQHELALQQMRGGYSDEIEKLRQELIDFTALLELELDFSEEDLEFADREKLKMLLQKISLVLKELINSFEYGNVIKNGVPVAIIGAPNVGKSTLLNALLNEEKAIVSEIPGTTRDFIEDEMVIDGINFRFIDTAGIRTTEDKLEAKGIERSFQKLQSAKIVLLLFDIKNPFQDIVEEIKKYKFGKEQDVLVLLNKADQDALCNAYDIEEAISTLSKKEVLAISALQKIHLDKLKKKLTEMVLKYKSQFNIQVSNARHVQAMKESQEAIENIEEGIKNNIGTEFLSSEARSALASLGSITGKITNEDILDSVFSRFCIGK